MINRTDMVHHQEKKVMTYVGKFSMVAIALAMLGTSFTAASAETPWQANHPRRVEVNSRLAT